MRTLFSYSVVPSDEVTQEQEHARKPHPHKEIKKPLKNNQTAFKVQLKQREQAKIGEDGIETETITLDEAPIVKQEDANKTVPIL